MSPGSGKAGAGKQMLAGTGGFSQRLPGGGRLLILLAVAWPLLIVLSPAIPDQDSSYTEAVASGSAYAGLFGGGLLERPATVGELSRLWQRAPDASARDVWLASYAHDLHPPLYMLLLYFSSYAISPDLHTTGLVLNLLFYACSLGLVWWLCRLLGASPRQALLALVLVGFSQYGWRVVAPVRMYALLHCLVLAYAVCTLKLRQAGEVAAFHQATLWLLCLGCLALAGTLTSFLFPVLAVFIFATALWLLPRYRLGFVAAHALAVGGFWALMGPALPSYWQANLGSAGMSAELNRWANLLEHIPKLIFPSALAAHALWLWGKGGLERGRRAAVAVALAGAGAASLLYWALWMAGFFIYWAIGWKYQGTFLLFAAPLIALAASEQRRLVPLLVAATMAVWLVSGYNYVRVQHRMGGLLALYEATQPDIIICDSTDPSHFPVLLERAPRQAEVICAEAARLPELLRASLAAPAPPRRLIYWSCGASEQARQRVLAALQELAGATSPPRKVKEYCRISAWAWPQPPRAEAASLLQPAR